MNLVLLFGLFLGQEPPVADLLREALELAHKSSSAELLQNANARMHVIDQYLHEVISRRGYTRLRMHVRISRFRKDRLSEYFVRGVWKDAATGVPGKLVTEIDLLELAEGATLKPGHKLRAEQIVRAWEFKTGRLDMSQHAMQKKALGRAPQVLRIDVDAFLKGGQQWLWDATSGAAIPFKQAIEPAVIPSEIEPKAALNVETPTTRKMLREVLERLQSQDRMTLWTRPDKRSPLIERELQRQIFEKGWSGVQMNVVIVKQNGAPVIARIGEEVLESVKGETLTEFDIVKLKPGKRLKVGDVFDRSVVEEVIELKTGELKPRQLSVQTELLGRSPRIWQLDVQAYLTGDRAWIRDCTRHTRLPLEHPHTYELQQAVVGAGRFMAAQTLSSALKAAQHLDGELFVRTIGAMASREYIGELAVFTVVSRLVEKQLKIGAIGARIANGSNVGRRLSHAALPMAMGMGVTDAFFRDRHDGLDVLLATGSVLASEPVVAWGMDRSIYPLLFRNKLPTWGGAAVYSIAKLGVTLFAAEKMHEGVRWGIDRWVDSKRSHAIPELRQGRNDN